MKDLLNIRPAGDDDKNFILNSWLTSYYVQEQRYSLRGLTKGVFMTDHRAAVVDALNRSTVYCAADRHDPSHIYGWVCVEPDGEGELALHYVYVKLPYRHMGICKALLSHSLGSQRFTFTHKPTFGLAKYFFEVAKYNPYRFFRRKAA